MNYVAKLAVERGKKVRHDVSSKLVISKPNWPVQMMEVAKNIHLNMVRELCN